MADWKIPPCVSNWKNAKGYTIPLDKRLAADGRGHSQAQSLSPSPSFYLPCPKPHPLSQPTAGHSLRLG